MATHSIPWVNDGEPFEVSEEEISPGAHQRAFRTKSHLYKEAFKDTASMHPEILRAYKEEVFAEIAIEMTTIYVHDILTRADKRIANLTPEKVRDKLSAEQFMALAKDLNANAKPEKAEQEGEVDPLEKQDEPSESSGEPNA